MVAGKLATVLVALAMALGGCGVATELKPVDDHELVGSWSLGEGTRLTFNEDGTFEGDLLPNYFLAPNYAGLSKGHWELEGVVPRQVQLTYRVPDEKGNWTDQVIAEHQALLAQHRSDGGVRLFYDDAGHQRDFTRVAD